jgi:hypothetical protein
MTERRIWSGSVCLRLHFATVLLGLVLIATTSSSSIGQSATTNPYIKNIVENVLPKKYPLLIKFARKKREFPVSWRAESGEIQTVTVHFEDEGVFVQGTIYTSTPDSQGSKPVIVMMFDSNLDSIIDLVMYTGTAVPGGTYSQRDPRDDATLTLWYTSLYAIIRFSKCC